MFVGLPFSPVDQFLLFKVQDIRINMKRMRNAAADNVFKTFFFFALQVRLVLTLVFGTSMGGVGLILGYNYWQSENLIFRTVGADSSIQAMCRMLFTTITLILFDTQIVVSLQLYNILYTVVFILRSFCKKICNNNALELSCTLKAFDPMVRYIFLEWKINPENDVDACFTWQVMWTTITTKVSFEFLAKRSHLPWVSTLSHHGKAQHLNFYFTQVLCLHHMNFFVWSQFKCQQR